ncbi:MAG: archease [Patescibacteria group bacterium]|nr:archease [Patescibacteria group bacterium]MCL5262027.1 archease [Patescibacteria group bacterium]
MPYRILGHTADIRLSVEGKDLEELFRDALKGMVFIAGPRESDDLKETNRKIKLSAADRTALLVDFLNEVLFGMEKNFEFYRDIEFEKLSPTGMRAILKARPAVRFERDIKAVTYHEADIVENENGVLATTIIFDI